VNLRTAPSVDLTRLCALVDPSQPRHARVVWIAGTIEAGLGAIKQTLEGNRAAA